MTLNDAGQVDYRAVIGVLNWRQHPVITTTTTTTTITGAPPPGSATAAPYGGSVWKSSASNEASGGERQLVQVVRADLLMQDLAATTA